MYFKPLAAAFLIACYFAGVFSSVTGASPRRDHRGPAQIQLQSNVFTAGIISASGYDAATQNPLNI